MAEHTDLKPGIPAVENNNPKPIEPTPVEPGNNYPIPVEDNTGTIIVSLF